MSDWEAVLVAAMRHSRRITPRQAYRYLQVPGFIIAYLHNTLASSRADKTEEHLRAAIYDLTPPPHTRKALRATCDLIAPHIQEDLLEEFTELRIILGQDIPAALAYLRSPHWNSGRLITAVCTHGTPGQIATLFSQLPSDQHFAIDELRSMLRPEIPACVRWLQAVTRKQVSDGRLPVAPLAALSAAAVPEALGAICTILDTATEQQVPYLKVHENALLYIAPWLVTAEVRGAFTRLLRSGAKMLINSRPCQAELRLLLDAGDLTFADLLAAAGDSASRLFIFTTCSAAADVVQDFLAGRKLLDQVDFEHGLHLEAVAEYSPPLPEHLLEPMVELLTRGGFGNHVREGLFAFLRKQHPDVATLLRREMEG